MNKRSHKYKKDRSLLLNVFDNPKSSFNRKPYKPGQHKKKVYSNTYYGELLYYKQRLLSYYSNIKDYQLKTILSKFIHLSNYKSRIVQLLESRIDVILYRSGCVKSMRAARQIINHKKVILIDNNNKQTIPKSPSVLINNNSTIMFCNSVIDSLKNILKVNTRAVPKHILFDKNDFKFVIQKDYIPMKDSYVDLKNLYLDQVASYYKL